MPFPPLLRSRVTPRELGVAALALGLGLALGHFLTRAAKPPPVHATSPTFVTALSSELASLEGDDLRAIDRCFKDVGLLPYSTLLAEEGEVWNTAESVDRDLSPSTRMIEEALAILPGMTVADLGAGAGYHTFRISQQVGPQGEVWATDTNTNMVVRIVRTAERKQAPNVHAVLVQENQLGLPAGLDRVLISNVYLFDDCRPLWNERYLSELARLIKPDGRLVVYEDFGTKRNACKSLGAAGLAKAAEPFFTQVSLQPSPYEARPGVTPGFLLVLQPRPEAAAPTATPGD